MLFYFDNAYSVSLYLDPQIRDWVLFPITLVMVSPYASLLPIPLSNCSHNTQILVGILRHYVVVLLQSPPKKLSGAALREQSVCLVYRVELFSDERTLLLEDVASCVLRFYAPALRNPTFLLHNTALYLGIYPMHLKLGPI